MRTETKAFPWCVVLLILGLACVIPLAADETAKPADVQEAPPTVVSGYGVNGLVLWLAADYEVSTDQNGGVTSLADKAGNFVLTPKNVDQEPTYVANGLNGKPVLRFNGAQSLYSSDTFSGVLNRDMTIIIVASSTSAVDREQFPLYLGQNSTPHQNRALPYYQGRETFDGQFVIRSGPPIAPQNTFIVFGASIDPTLSLATFYRNGKKTAVNSSDEIDRNANFENLSDGVTMGAATDPVCGWVGDIAEELVFNRQLTPVEMQTIWSSLSSKYGLHDISATP